MFFRRQIAPFIDSLASKYPNVNFIKVDVDQQADVAGERGISAMPTFQFFVAGNMVDEIKGANPAEIEKRVIQHKVEIDPFAGQGFTLASSGPPASSNPQDMREARLKAMGVSSAAANVPPAPAKSASTGGKDVFALAAAASMMEDDDEEIAKAIALSMEQAAAASSGEKATAAAEPTASVAEQRTAKAKADAAAQDAIDTAEAEAEQVGEQCITIVFNRNSWEKLAPSPSQNIISSLHVSLSFLFLKSPLLFSISIRRF